MVWCPKQIPGTGTTLMFSILSAFPSVDQHVKTEFAPCGPNAAAGETQDATFVQAVGAAASAGTDL